MTEQELAIDAIRRLNRSGIACLLAGAMATNRWIEISELDVKMRRRKPHFQLATTCLNAFRKDSISAFVPIVRRMRFGMAGNKRPACMLRGSPLAFAATPFDVSFEREDHGSETAREVQVICPF